VEFFSVHRVDLLAAQALDLLLNIKQLRTHHSLCLLKLVLQQLLPLLAPPRRLTHLRHTPSPLPVNLL
jgi:hypothetical protein